MQSIKNATIQGSSPLILLRLIRDVMAQPLSAQSRLDQVVRVIAEGMISDVCSVYLLRAGDILELYASVGLNANAVHNTRLNMNRGLVGTVAATAEIINIADAQGHVKYEYRPETGEEQFHSFAGVPILQGGKAIGVLVVQRTLAQEYVSEQIEVLQTVAMVLSELAISGQLVDTQEIKTATGGLAAEQMAGMRLSSGIASAPAILYQPQQEIHDYVASDTNHEKERFDNALQSLQEQYDAMIQSAGLEEDDEQHQLLEAYMMFMQDKGWNRRIIEAIYSGLTAEAAVRKVQEELRARMSQLSSHYIKERIDDLEDLSNHLLKTLLGKNLADMENLPDEFILVARSLGPAELLEYDHTKLKGLILEEGSSTAHTAVIARAMDIPAIGRVNKATSIINSGDMLILDADEGTVYVRPSEQVQEVMQRRLMQQASREAEYAAYRELPAVTKDGVRISLNVNAGLFVDPNTVLQEGVDGIGLYRTELPYMTSDYFPEVEVQRDLYRRMYDQLPGKRIIFRSFDIGGDKKVPYLHAGEEENPAMGWRATRIGLERPGILRDQFQALIGAADGKPLHLLFPFIAQVSEFDTVKQLLDQTLAQSEVKPSAVKLGIMIEIPSILWQLDELMPRVDFVSIGSNDLMQFLFACDRGAVHMNDAYDTLSPTMLRVITHVLQKADAYGVEVSFCGEMARKPLDALALIGVGVRSLSVSASAIGPLKALIRSLTLGDVTSYITYLTQSSQPSVRSWLAAFAKDHGIKI